MGKIRDLIHKINSPLTTVIGYSELLERREIGEKEKEWAKKIHAETLRIKDLIKELSDTVTETSD
jgi:signal transduction histidine kinase